MTTSGLAGLRCAIVDDSMMIRKSLLRHVARALKGRVLRCGPRQVPKVERLSEVTEQLLVARHDAGLGADRLVEEARAAARAGDAQPELEDHRSHIGQPVVMAAF